jgi:hypothetical protein
MIKESDWKKFKVAKEHALERFCSDAMADFAEAINKKDLSNYARYIYLYKLVENADKRLALLFDGHSRSKALLQLTLLRSEGLIADSDLDGMSDEILKSTKPR